MLGDRGACPRKSRHRPHRDRRVLRAGRNGRDQKPALPAEARKGADRSALEEPGRACDPRAVQLRTTNFQRLVGAAHAEEVPSEPCNEWRDEITFTLAPGESAE